MLASKKKRTCAFVLHCLNQEQESTVNTHLTFSIYVTPGILVSRDETQREREEPGNEIEKL